MKMKKFVKSSLLTVASIGLSFSLLQGVSAAEKIAGKCSLTIVPTKHKTIETSAKATGICEKRVKGWYANGEYTVTGGYDGSVVDGEKYLVSVPPAWGKYEVTVHTVSQIQTLKAPTVHSVNTTDKKVTGTTEPNVKVTVKAGKAALGSAKSNKNGNYSVTLKKAQKVGTKLTVTITKGKESKSKSITVKYKAPNVNTVKTTTNYVKGTTIAGAKVTVKSGSKTIGTATANSKGAFTVKISKQKPGVKITVTATKSKNTSETKTVTVK
ncbi:Ig-like domain-containing protein [Peribacillus asahii]|uniref:Ig-like domain-containing protein n=1 Tax=Peribacillus asahii TaxID=228899 RepID=UPI00207A2D0C|nr:Ig-like domain-containing protein [Peribacillus asahii]USK62329.1 Ig-like domain-containing protein [Peribacillus asahii]